MTDRLSRRQVRALNNVDQEVSALGRNRFSQNDEIKLGDMFVELFEWHKFALGVGDDVEVDTGYDLPTHAIVHDILLEVVAPEVSGTTKTIDAGLKAAESGGDADGFIDGMSIATAGLFRPGATVAGGVWTASTRGVLLASFTAGAGADDRGLYSENPHMTDLVTAKSLTWTRGDDDWVEFQGFLWVKVKRLVG